MSSPPPRVSVLFPVYNGGRYLTAAMASVLGQTFRDFELIAVDDGSTDRSPEVLARFAAADPRVRVIRRPNAGLVASLNEALAVARAPLVARMDADDVCRPTRFAQQVAYLAAQPDYVLVGTQAMTIDPGGRPIGHMMTVTFGHDRIVTALLRRGWPLVHPTVMMRTDALRRVGAYRAPAWPYEDHDLFLRLAEVGRLNNLPDVLLDYRKHPASISAQNGGRRDAILKGIIVDACRRRGVPVHPEVTVARTSPETTADTERFWAWQAVKERHLWTARKYALHTLWRRPLTLDSWKLAYCAVRGR